MTKLTWRQRFWATSSEEAARDMQRVRPFFILLTLAMAIIYAWSIADSPRLHSWESITVFTLLMITHVALYWLSPHWVHTRLKAAIYLIVQGILAFSLVMLAGNAALAFGLFAGLIGNTVGMLGRNRTMALAVFLEVGASALSFVLIAGTVSLGIWALSTGPIVAFAIIYVTLYVRETEARDHAQRLLRDLDVAHRQLTEYAAQVEDLTLASERQRMARELHDTLSQGLAGLVLQLEAIDSHLSRGNAPKAQAITQQAMERARSTLADVRRAIDDLRSGDLADLDLETAVRQEADRFTATTGISCDLVISLPASLPDDVRDNTLRIVAEALTNVARYAQAQHVTINLRPIDQSLAVEVCDDGVGFDPALVGAGHYGLIGLRERTRLIGGTLNIESAPGQGTTLKVQLPLVAGG